MSAEVLNQEFADGGAIQRLLLAYAGARMAQLSQRAVCNGRHSVIERLCSWLLMIHDRVGDDQLPLKHEQIARHLGTRRAGITEAAINLRDSQLISCSRGQIRITDRQGLEMAACECYRTLSRQNLLTLQP
jgi:CRP-like cAMP-binding protein